MRVVIKNNLWAEFEGAHEQLEQLMRFRPSGYRFAPSYKLWEDSKHKRGWDGWISLLRHKGGITLIPAGLLNLVQRQPWAQGWEVDDLRTEPHPPTLLPNHEWRDCLCAEIDPADRPCIVCEARGPIYATT